MKNISKALSVLFLGVMLFTLNSCSEDNPVIERSWIEGPTTNGSLTVYVKIGITTNYCGGAFVYLYESEEDMVADNYIAKNITDPFKPLPADGKGAYFGDLPFQNYWIKATWQKDQNSQLYTGTTTSWALRGQDLNVEVSVSF